MSDPDSSGAPGAKPRRVLEVLQAATEYLACRDVQPPVRLTVELLAAHVLRCRRLELYLRFDQLLTDPQLRDLRDGVRRLAAGEPLQYVAGTAEFMGHTFRTDRRALIPRPETERLVQAVLDCAELWALPGPAIADVGTGSGCVIASLALAHAAADYVALDLSPECLALARENAESLGVATRVVFRESDLLGVIAPASLDGVVSNPPYVSRPALLEVGRHIREYEPASALDGGADGMDVIRRLVPQAADRLRARGWLFLEIGHDQGPRTVDLLERSGFGDVKVAKDLGGHDRIVSGRKTGPDKAKDVSAG